MHVRKVPVSKRIFDLALTLPGLVLLSPLLAGAALALWLTEGRPLLFSQPRPGLGGRIFTLYKFRTMRAEFDQNGQPLPDAQRIFPLGRSLRMLSIDELPQLFNIVRGEMSLVGPRPLLESYLERYSAEQMRRHEVLPGITGWAQVNGRNALSWEDRFRFDVWYVDNWSLWLDIKILALSVLKVLRREGISEPGEATAREFMGSPKE